MKIFVDTNVIIDYLVDRAPFADDAEAVIDVCTRDGNEGAFTGLSACNAAPNIPLAICGGVLI